MFMLVSRRYERARLIVTSNKPFSAWGEIFGDDMAAVRLRQEPTEMGVANCVCC
jgi:DNA replication protein DnaC